MVEAALKSDIEDDEKPAKVVEAVEEAEETPAVEATEEKAEEADDQAEIEQRARFLGWRPKDKYPGDPEDWKDAKDFVAFQERDNRRMRQAIDKMIPRMAKIEKFNEELIKRLDGDEASRFEQQLMNVRAKMRDAVKSGDEEGFLKWEAEELKLRKDGAPKAPEKKPGPTEEPTEIKDWKTKRPWFDRDMAMTEEAVGYYRAYQVKNKDCSIEDALDHVDKRMAREYPELYENPRRREAPKVEGGGAVKIGKKGAKGWADIPAEDKALAKSLIKDGTFPDNESYAKSYWSQFEGRH